MPKLFGGTKLCYRTFYISEYEMMFVLFRSVRIPDNTGLNVASGGFINVILVSDHLYRISKTNVGLYKELITECHNPCPLQLLVTKPNRASGCTVTLYPIN